MAHRDDKKRFIDYILPFLIFVSLGIIIVLSVQLWRTLNPQNLSSEAYLYIDQGKAQILPWGIDQWEPGFNGSKILQGDVIKLSSKGRAVLTLFDGSVVRLGPNSEIKINDLSENGNNYEARFSLQNGLAWINVAPNKHGNSQIEVRSEHLNAISTGTIFSVESQNEETIRLFEGSLELEVLLTNEGTEQIAEKIQLSAGKQVTLTSSDVKAYQDRQSPNVIAEIPQTFKESDWYIWNQAEDQNPTEFTAKKGRPAITIEPATPDTSSEPASTQETTDPEEETTEEEDTFLKPPTVTSPAGELTTEKNEILIKGSVPQNTEKVIVVSEENGIKDEYTLQNFNPGDNNWQYKAATRFGNLQEGKNEFEIFAVDQNGTRSPAAKAVIIYQPKEEEATPDNE